MGDKEETLFFTGYARLPAGITASEISKIVGIGLEVEAATGKILRADCTLATATGRRFFSRLVRGHHLDRDFDYMVAQIERRYHGSAQKSLIAALKIALEKYRTYKRHSPSTGTSPRPSSTLSPEPSD